MSKIDIRRSHSLPVAEARKQADLMARHLNKEFDLQSRWRNGELHFERSGVQGVMKVSAQEVHISADLGFVLSLIKSKIEARLNSHFDDVFGADRPKPKAEAAAGSRARKQAGEALTTPARRKR